MIMCRWGHEVELAEQLDVVELLEVVPSWQQHPDQMTGCLHVRSRQPATTSSLSPSPCISVDIQTATNDSASNTTCWDTRPSSTAESRWEVSRPGKVRQRSHWVMTWQPATTNSLSPRRCISVDIRTVADDSASNTTSWDTRPSSTAESLWDVSRPGNH